MTPTCLGFRVYRGYVLLVPEAQKNVERRAMVVRAVFGEFWVTISFASGVQVYTFHMIPHMAWGRVSDSEFRICRLLKLELRLRVYGLGRASGGF